MLSKRQFMQQHNAILDAISENPGEKLGYRVLADLHQEHTDFRLPNIARAASWLAKTKIVLAKTVPNRLGPIAEDEVIDPKLVRYAWGSDRTSLFHPDSKLPFLLFRVLKDNPKTHRFSAKVACYKTVRKAFAELGRALLHLDNLCNGDFFTDV